MSARYKWRSPLSNTDLQNYQELLSFPSLTPLHLSFPPLYLSTFQRHLESTSHLLIMLTLTSSSNAHHEFTMATISKALLLALALSTTISAIPIPSITDLSTGTTGERSLDSWAEGIFGEPAPGPEAPCNTNLPHCGIVAAPPGAPSQPTPAPSSGGPVGEGGPQATSGKSG
jgi:hypothetical protein